MSRTVLVIVAVVFIVAILLLALDYKEGFQKESGGKRVHVLDDFEWNMSDDFGGNSEEVRKWQSTR